MLCIHHDFYHPSLKATNLNLLRAVKSQQTKQGINEEREEEIGSAFLFLYIVWRQKTPIHYVALMCISCVAS